MKYQEIVEGVLTNPTRHDLEKVRDWMLENGFEADPIQDDYERFYSYQDNEIYDFGFDAGYVPKNRRDRFKKVFKSELIHVGIKDYKHRKVFVLIFHEHEGSLHYSADEVIDEIRRYYKI